MRSARLVPARSVFLVVHAPTRLRLIQKVQSPNTLEPGFCSRLDLFRSPLTVVVRLGGSVVREFDSIAWGYSYSVVKTKQMVRRGLQVIHKENNPEVAKLIHNEISILHNVSVRAPCSAGRAKNMMYRAEKPRQSRVAVVAW